MRFWPGSEDNMSPMERYRRAKVACFCSWFYIVGGVLGFLCALGGGTIREWLIPLMMLGYGIGQQIEGRKKVQQYRSTSNK